MICYFVFRGINKINKINDGFGSSTFITVVGFNSDLATTDQQAAVDGLHAFFCFFPMIGTIFAMLIMRNYSITEERANEIREKLKTRKNHK